MSDLRLLAGSAGTATTPTAPLTAITNTQLLTNMANAGIPDLAMQNNLQTVGNAQVSTSVKKYGTGSLNFPSSGTNYLASTSSTSLYAFGTGDFTIEFWLYITTTSSAQNIYDTRPASTTGAYNMIYCNSGAITYNTNNADQIIGSTLSINTWYHIAVCRSGTSTKLFVNGAQSGSTYTDSTNYIVGSGRPVVGANAYNLGTYGLNNGYIDDLRITNGLARYTANFTPPTSALPTY